MAWSPDNPVVGEFEDIPAYPVNWALYKRIEPTPAVPPAPIEKVVSIPDAPSTETVVCSASTTASPAQAVVSIAEPMPLTEDRTDAPSIVNDSCPLSPSDTHPVAADSRPDAAPKTKHSALSSRLPSIGKKLNTIINDPVCRSQRDHRHDHWGTARRHMLTTPTAQPALRTKHSALLSYGF